MDPLRTRFVLIEPSHAGNVGAVARAMKVMGFDDLVLVAPRWPDVLERPEAVERASGAADVLARARIVATLDEALGGISHLCATVMTPRDIGPPTRSPRSHFELLLDQELAALAGQALEPGSDPKPELGVGFLFGCERHGMSNADVYRCHVALSIPTSPGYGSLNLAAAVQLIAYDWRQALAARGAGWAAPARGAALARDVADAWQVGQMLEHWEQALMEIGFLDPAAPRKLMPRLRQLFNRARPSREEIHILRGIARAMQDAAAGRRH